MGSMFRTADAAGVQQIYLCGITPQPLDRFGKPRQQFVKVSLGAEKSVPWRYAADTSQLIDQLKKDGYHVYAIEQSKKAMPYYQARKKNLNRVAVVMGNEVTGLSPKILRKADRILEIPMHGKKESLNVAAAAGIILFGVRY